MMELITHDKTTNTFVLFIYLGDVERILIEININECTKILSEVTHFIKINTKTNTIYYHLNPITK